MKLVKVLSPTPTVGIKEKVELSDYVLLSDAKFRLLQFNHVDMDIVMDFVDSNAEDIVDINKERPLIIQKIIPDPLKKYAGDMPKVTNGKVDCSTDLKDVEVGKCVFYYVPKPPIAKEDLVEPVQPTAPTAPTAPELPYTEYKLDTYHKALQKFHEEAYAYAAAVAKYEVDKKNYTKWSAEWTAYEKAIVSPAYGLVIEKTADNKAKIQCDISFITTKTDPQYHSYGRFPLDAPLKITKTLGGFKADDSLKGMTWVEILKNLLGLEADVVLEKDIEITTTASATDKSQQISKE